MLNTITFGDKNSYDNFELILNNKTINTPAKKKIKIDVPFANSSYDFSTIGSGGDIVYSNRNIEAKFTIIADSKTELNIMFNKIKAWLLDSGKEKIIFNDMIDLYFLGEVEGEFSLIEDGNYGEFTVNFVCDPFARGINLEGADIWDTFNFETDVAQDTEFIVSSSKSINLINVGRVITPVINVSNPMTITFDSKTYNLTTGDNKLYGFKLKNGNNNISITGTGTIKFIWRKEVL